MKKAQRTPREIFVEAIQQDSKQGMRDYLDAASAGDPNLRAEVDELLVAHQLAGRFMGDYDPAVETQDQCAGLEIIGQTIGPYKLLEVIGEGGMGTVYMAKQTAPVNRRVAVKLIKTGMDTRQVMARFEAERQALALMDHPNIAKVLDAGATESGRPYFAMELVKGQPITKFCDEQKLNLDSRLRLFQKVCHAVQHAHQKGIIHRDLKPSNVLVAMYDDKPVPKVIDFGVAKATGEEMTDKTMFTRFGQIVGTLEYMSPEQAQLNNLDIDTRSDIYSLGAILYELLAGEPPFEGQKIRKQALDETLRMIREDEPTKPSTKLSGTAKSAQVASNRNLTIEKLGLILRGDLDWIVMKSLNKERSLRYETATGLATDIDRYLDDQPVSASPPSVFYSVSKLVKRNKLAFTAGCLGLLFFIATTGILLASNYMLKKSERKATASLDQAMQSIGLVESIFDDLDMWSIDNDPTKTLHSVLAERLVLAGSQLNQSVGDQLRIAQIQDKLGGSLVSLGHANESIEILEDSLDSKMALLNETDPELVKTKHLLAVGYREAGEFRRAIELLKGVVAAYEDTVGTQNPSTIRSTKALAGCYQDSGDLDRAIDLLRKAHRASIITNGQRHSETIGIENSLGTCYWKLGRHKKAISIFQQVSEYYKQELGPDSPYYMNAINNLGQAYVGAKDFESALPLLNKSYNWAHQNIGPEHPSTKTYMNNLALLMVHRGEAERGAELLESLLELSANELAEGDRGTALHITNLARCYDRLGRTEDAIRLLEDAYNSPFERVASTVFPVLLPLYMENGQLSEAVSLAENELHTYQNDSSRNPNQLANNKAFICQICLIPAKKFKRAEKHLYDAMSIFEASGDDDKVFTIKSMLAESLVAQDRFPEAETHLLAIEEVLRSTLAGRKKTIPDQWQTFETESLLGEALLRQQKFSEAEPILLNGFQGLIERKDSIPSVDKKCLHESIQRLVKLYESWHKINPDDGYDAKANRWKKTLAEYEERLTPKQSPQPTTKN